jgi:hypothetical protein
MAIKFSEMKELLKDTDIQTIKLSDPVYNSCMRQLTQNIVSDNPSAGKISFDILNKMKLQNKLSMVQFTYFDFIEYECIGFDNRNRNVQLENIEIKFAHGEDVFGAISLMETKIRDIDRKYIEYNPFLFINRKDDLGISYIYTSFDLQTISELKPISVYKQRIDNSILKYIHFPYMSTSMFYQKNIIFSYNINDDINLICCCKKPTDNTYNFSKLSIRIRFRFVGAATYNVVHNYGDIAAFMDVVEFEKNDRIQILDETFKFI